MSTEYFEWNDYIIYKNAIGRGMYSKVYYGYNKTTKLEIALKKILFSKLHNNIKDRIISEINILQRINHDNVIKLYDYKFDGDYILLITEYCKHGDISIWMNKDHTYAEIIKVIKQNLYRYSN
jgi:serine/threonine protein kinase